MRNIANVVHDLKPPVETGKDLAIILGEMCEQQLPKTQAPDIFKGITHLNQLLDTIFKYICDLEKEVKKSGVVKE